MPYLSEKPLEIGTLDLSIIIVNWNSVHDLKYCIQSIKSTVKKIQYEIIVIDGGSFDGCDVMLAQCYPEVHFIQSKDNLGFSRANNVAFSASRGEVILFLNPDTVVFENAIALLFKRIKTLKNAGIVGARLLNSDFTVQKTSIRVFPTIANEALDADILMRLFPNSKLWKTSILEKNTKTPVEVDAVSGACLMIHRSIFREVNRFSEDYFMYAEDLDLCHKVKLLNKEVYYVPDAHVLHHGGTSSSKAEVSTFSVITMLESKYRYFSKFNGESYSNRFRIAIFGTSLIRILLLTLLFPLTLVIKRSNSTLKSVRKWIAKLKWAIGLEKWAKDY